MMQEKDKKITTDDSHHEENQYVPAEGSHLREETPHHILFEERQYMGYNRYSMLRRMVMAIFCFLAYYWQEEGENHGHLFFLVGMSILVISGLMLFVLHLHTRVYQGNIIIDGLWTSRKVKIDLNSIVSAEKSTYDSSFYQPVYNLHRKGTIRFYTSGNDAVKITDKDGLVYLIGTQRGTELEKVIMNQIQEKINFKN